jgi:hypothetical protein
LFGDEVAKAGLVFQIVNDLSVRVAFGKHEVDEVAEVLWQASDFAGAAP